MSRVSFARGTFPSFESHDELVLRDQLSKIKIPVASSCDGDGVCGKCAIRVSPSSAVTPLSDFEKEVLERNQKNPSLFRLSCQIHVKDDLEIDASYW